MARQAQLRQHAREDLDARFKLFRDDLVSAEFTQVSDLRHVTRAHDDVYLGIHLASKRHCETCGSGIGNRQHEYARVVDADGMQHFAARCVAVDDAFAFSARAAHRVGI